MMQILVMLVFLLVWLTMWWIGSILLEMTGMERSRARFQALSAISGTGFTTSHAEEVVDNPRRRQIVSYLIIIGNAGILSLIIAVIIYVRAGLALPSWEIILAIVLLIAALVIVIRIGIIDKITGLIVVAIRGAKNKSRLRVAQIFYNNNDLAIVKLKTQGPFTGKVDIPDIATLQTKGINIIAIERGKDILKNPSAETKILAEDLIVCSGDIRIITDFK
jgi:hypothetical protein